MGNFSHIYVLIWKNIKIDIRHPWRTAIVFLTPIICMCLLIVFRVNAGHEIRDRETIFDSYDINTLPEEEFNVSNAYHLYYTPKSAFIDKVMKEVASYMNISSIGFDTEAELVSSYVSSGLKVFAGVVFHPNLKNGPSMYGPIEYTIRPEMILGIAWNLSSIGPSVTTFNLVDKTIWGTPYMWYGFLTVQHVVTKTLLENFFPTMDKKFDDLFVVEMRRQPYPRYEVDLFYKTPDAFISITILISFFFPSIIIVKSLVHERQTKMKQILVFMGISNWENWTSWFIKQFILLSLCCIIINALLCIKFGEYAVLNKSDASLILLLLILYATSLIAFIFFVSTLFDDENSAAAAVCILFILTYMPYVHGITLFEDIPLYSQRLSCLLPNTLFAYSVRTVLGLELLGEGLRWNTLYVTDKSHDSFNMHIIFIFFIVDILIYFIITWYIDGMCPGQSQIRYPWYFPFMGRYWTGNKDIPPMASLHQFQYKKPDFYEKDPPRVRPMINVKNLSKVYNRYSKPVLKQIDLRAYKGQITVLLGSNSSGKSTFASLLYGAVLPTSGTILLKDHNMCTSRDFQKVLPLLGICPDFNISIDELNVEDNIYFFCRIKGYDTGLEAEVYHILALFDLEIRKRRSISTLSLSAKRRLSVGIALAGDSEILILDEPTLNMDSYSRRITWDALHSEKTTRAIFLTSSNMKEANALADRIAVLQNGHIKCCGSPLFLKNKYGAGFLLIISKDPECSSTVLKNIIFSKIPDAAVVNDTESELKVMLPHDSCELYQHVFKEFEDRIDVKIKSLFITETTLNELFEKISGESVHSIKEHAVGEDNVFRYFTRKRNEGFTLFCQHVLALLKKRHTLSHRNTILIACLVLVLPFLTALSSLLKERKKFVTQEFRNVSIFNLNGFGKTDVVFGIDPSSNVTIFLGDIYGSLLDSENLELIDLEEKNYLMHLIEQGMKDLFSYKTKYIVGAVFAEKFGKSTITAFYNAEAYHSAPTSLLYVHNTILKYYTKESNFYFNVKNHPLPFKDIEGEVWSSDFDLSESFFWAQDLIIGMAIFMSSYIVLLVIEKSTYSKKQQMINGLNAFVYWFATLIYDFGLYILSCLFTLLTLTLFQTECLSLEEDISALAYLLLLHGLSTLLFIYCCTFCVKSSSVAYTCIFLYYFISLFLLSIVYTLELSQLYHISEPLNIIFTAFMPSYCVGRGIYNIYRNCKSNYICNNNLTQTRCMYRNSTMVFCCLDYCGDHCLYWSAEHYSLSLTGIGKQFIALIIQPFVFCLILILFEMEIFQNLRLRIKERSMSYYDAPSFAIDKSVQEEANKILTSPLPKLQDEKLYVILRNVSKIFPQNAVGKFSFGIKKGECFGLLAIDNSGKSTVLNVISGSVPLSTGNIYIDGFSVMKYPDKVQDKIGFSFGNNALLKQLTVKETLTLYSRIRGIPENEIPYVIKILIDVLSLKGHMLIKNCNYSNRRKISVAISLIGTPPLILVDEPTDDMDPESCTTTRKALKHALGLGCTIILASCNIDECQALCHRIGILVNGKLNYLGDIDYLKSQYANGFTLILRVEKSRKESSKRHTRRALTVKGGLDEIKGLIEDALPTAILKIEHMSFVNYFVPERTIIWSSLLSLLETMKFKDMIVNYTICETNLENIFGYHVDRSDDFGETEIAAFLKARKKYTNV